MSLWLIRTVDPCLEYLDRGSCIPPPGPPLRGPLGLTYNGSLITCPRHYKQSISKISNFFYEPENDILVAHALLYTTYWPSWDAIRYEFSAEDGSWINREDVLAGRAFIGVWGAAYTQKATLGSFGRIYACRNNEYNIREITWQNATPTVGGWSINPYTWTPKNIYKFAVVNRADNIIAASQNWTLDLWNNTGGTPNRFAQLRLPGVCNYLAYESRTYCWVITQEGTIGKVDYQTPRWEMISSVNEPQVDDTGYAITFDTKRKRVIVFRQRADAADGAARHRIEFYYPMVSPGQLTQPVPVTPIRSDSQILFVAHLIGTAGEGMTPYSVTGELLAPVEGVLTTPFSGTGLNGKVTFAYQSPEGPCDETLRLTVDVEESI